jgi:hypothetical protein
VKEGKEEEKALITGHHITADLFCLVCNSKKPIGWKYIKAHQPSQKYKEGRFILERSYIQRVAWVAD